MIEDIVVLILPNGDKIGCKPAPIMYETGRPIYCPFCGTKTMVTSIISELPHRELKGECPQCRTLITASV